MKFTSEDLLKAMGLKVGDTIKFDNKEYVLCKNDYQGYHSYVFRETKPFGDVIKLINLLDWNYTIIQPKPTLTEDEKVILRNLPKEYNWIARNKGKDIVTMFTDFPDRDKEVWEFCDASWNLPFRNLFKFIKWEDEPYSIEELLNE